METTNQNKESKTTYQIIELRYTLGDEERVKREIYKNDHLMVLEDYPKDSDRNNLESIIEAITELGDTTKKVYDQTARRAMDTGRHFVNGLKYR